MPPLASSKRPLRRSTAPVKAPRSWPKSSEASKPSGSAAQLTLTRGRFARGEAAWIARAISSLPVPVSPVISTVAFVGATHATRSITSDNDAEAPMMPERNDLRPISTSPGS